MLYQTGSYAYSAIRSEEPRLVSSGVADSLVEYRAAQKAATEELDELTFSESLGCCHGVFFQVLSLLTFGIFIFEAVVYNTSFLMQILPATGEDIDFPPCIAFFNLFWAMSFWSFVQARCSNPGVVPLRWKDFVQKAGFAMPLSSALQTWLPGTAVYCKFCRMPRPERAHHCRITGCCVLRMDHFCPWINNCVGFRNYKFFILLILYTSLLTVVELTTTMTSWIKCIKALKGTDEDLLFRDEMPSIPDMQAFVTCCCICIVRGFVLLPIVCTHLSLARRNITAIEANYDATNPYDFNDWRLNLEEVFGSFGADWLVPVRPLHPKGDGVSFCRPDETLDGEDDAEGEELWRIRYRLPAPPPPLPRSSNVTSISSLIERPYPAPFGQPEQLPSLLHSSQIKDASEVAGLIDLLESCGLLDKLPEAIAWCYAHGADSIAEIKAVKMESNFVQALDLKPVKAKLMLTRLSGG